MSPTVEGAGVELSYREHGDGPAVLLIHGLASDAEAWETLLADLAADARVIAYDRRGYGASGMPEAYERTTVSEQAEDAAALLDRLAAGPALVCGDGLGALVALDLLIRHGDAARAAVLSQPPLYAFVPEATELLSDQRGVLARALLESGPACAVERWLGGRLEGAALERARHAHRAFFADFAALTSWPVTRSDLRAIAAPVVVVTGAETPGHIRAAADALADLVPDAERRRDADLAAAVRLLLAR